MMKIRFLGTGTSTGNPEIGCICEVCTSTDTKDRRWRASALIEVDGRTILIDCGPDFRMQMLETFRERRIERLDGVLLTHEHYDHAGGLDDLRFFSKVNPVPIYAQQDVLEAIRVRMPYVFAETKYPGIPKMQLQEIEAGIPFFVNGLEILPVCVMHGWLPVLGFRIGNMAYLTDLKTIPDSSYSLLQGLDVLVINALRDKEHISHQTTQDALRQIEKLRPQRSYLIHMNHHFGLHEVMQQKMPDNVWIAYDGLEIT